MIPFSVSVLIPTKNRKDLLQRSLKSVLNQSIVPEEIIIVNDGSIDQTKTFLENFKLKNKNLNLKVIHIKNSGGVNFARNQGIKEAKSEWIAFLDDDDEFFSEAIKIIKEKISKIPKQFNVAFFNSKITNSKGSMVGGFQFDNIKKELDFYDPTYQDTMIKFNLKGDCKPVFRKSLFESGSYKFPETVNGFESYILNLIARDKKGIRYYKNVVTHIHQELDLVDRLSITASAKRPWFMIVLHFKQFFQHYKFYMSHPIYFFKKNITLFKLLIRVIFR